METLLSRNPFQSQDLSHLEGMTKAYLDQAKQHRAAAMESFGKLPRPKARPESLLADQDPLGQTRPQARPGGDTFQDSFAQYGLAENVPRSLIQTESGGRWDAQNNETGSSGRAGHFGLVQFGQDRLDDARRAGIIPQDMTPQQFMADQKAQVAATNWHFSDIDNRIKSAGYDGLIGQTIGGTPITMNGMRAMAHLGGFGGLSKFINTGGRYNPSDSFKTSLSAYGQKHSNY